MIKMRLFKKGLTCYRKNELSKAKRVFSKILHKNHNNIDVLALLGRINLEEQNFIPAIKYLKKAEQKDSKNLEIQNNLALAFEQLGQNINDVHVDKKFKAFIKSLVPVYRYRGIDNYKTDIEIKSKITSLLHWEADLIWREILKPCNDPKKIIPNNLEYLINFAFSDDSSIFNEREMSYYTQWLWKRVLEIDKSSFLAATKLREYKKRCETVEMKNYISLTEQLSLSGDKDFLKKAKADLIDSDYGKTIKDSFCELSTQHFEVNEIKKVYQSHRELVQILEVYNEYKKGLSLEDAGWQLYKLGVTKEDIECQTFIIPLLIDKKSINTMLLNKPFYERVERIKQAYLKTGNFFRLIRDLEDFEKAYPENINIKLNMYRLYSKIGKDLKAKEKIAEVSRLIPYDNQKELEKSLIVYFPKISKNDTSILVDNFFTEISPPSAFVFKKSKSYKNLKKEQNTLNILEDLNREEHLELKLPRVLSCTKNGDYSCLAMESSLYIQPTTRCISLHARDLAEELNHRQDGEKSLLLKKVVEEIAKIHAHTPEDLLQQVHTADKEKNDKYYIDKIKQKFFGNLNKLIKNYNRSIESNIKEYNVKNRQWIKSVNKASVEKEVKERLKQKIDLYDGMLKQIENDNFKIEQPVLFMPRFNRGYTAIAPHWEEYIQKCKENAKNNKDSFFRDRAMKLVEEAKKEFKRGRTFPAPFSFYSRRILGKESYNSFAERELSKEDYKESIKITIEDEKKRIACSLERCIKEEIKSRKKSIKESNKKWRMQCKKKKSYIKVMPEQEHQFFKDYFVILDAISSLKPGTYKDVIFKNFLVDNKNDLITIDFETLRNTPYQMDLATAFEFGDFVSDNDSEENSRKNLLKVYVQKFNELVEKYDLSKEKIKDLEKFEKDYYACAIQRALVHYGSFSSLGYKDCAEFIKKSIWNVGKLKTYCNNESLEYQKLSNLEKHLTGFLDIAEKYSSRC